MITALIVALVGYWLIIVGYFVITVLNCCFSRVLCDNCIKLLL